MDSIISILRSRSSVAEGGSAGFAVLVARDTVLESNSILAYVPSQPLAIVAAALYLAMGILLFINLWRRRDWWALCLPIGACCEAFGLIMRVPLVNNQGSIGLYVAGNLPVVLSPACFLAFNYIVYGRLIPLLGRKYSLIKPRIVGKLFIISDVVTFFIQAAGGGLEAAHGQTAELGQKVFLVGLILQAVSYGLFMVLFGVAHLRLKRDGFKGSFWVVFMVLWVSSAAIMVRCIYRVVELAQGFEGTLYTHEAYFYALDTLPLLIAIAVWIPFWPSRFFPLNETGLEMTETQDSGDKP